MHISLHNIYYIHEIDVIYNFGTVYGVHIFY